MIWYCNNQMLHQNILYALVFTADVKDDVVFSTVDRSVVVVVTIKCVIFLHLKTQEKIANTRKSQGKHREFHFNLSVATLW